MLTIKVVKWKKVYFTGMMPYLFCVSVIVVLLSINSYFATEFGYIKKVSINGTETNLTEVVCYESLNPITNYIWSWVRFVFY